MNKEFRPGDYSKDKLFFGSDYHFNHERSIQFDNRPYRNVKEMNEALVANHNEIVSEDSLTYMLGDISMGKDVNSVTSYLNRMNGKKVLIIGNHDTTMMKEQAFRDCFTYIDNYYRPTLHGVKIAMMHFPIAEWDQAFRGAWHLHGHLHLGKADIKDGKFLNIGVMNNNYRPFSFNQIEKYMEKQPNKTNHHN